MDVSNDQSAPSRFRAVFFHLLRVGLGALFLSSGIFKAADPGHFLVAIRSFEILPDPWAPLLALSLPWLEILTGFCLVFRRLYQSALLISAGMLVVFLTAILSGWLRELEIQCGCFGPGSGEGNYLLLVGRNLALLSVCAALIWNARKESMPEDSSET